MSKEEAPRRRRRRTEPPEVPLSDLDRATKAALAADPGSAVARRHAQEALFHLLSTLTPALPNELLSKASLPAAEQRAEWLRALRFFTGTECTPVFRSLAISLSELDRGVTAPSLKAKAGGVRGGLAGTERLQLMSYAVEAADELKRRCRYDQEYRAELIECGTSYSTIHGYRSRLTVGPEELRPRMTYMLAWGDEPPELLLQRVIWAIEEIDARKIE